MKITALAITALATVASVASADDYQPALRALAAQEPTAPIADTHLLPTRPSNNPLLMWRLLLQLPTRSIMASHQ
uniref:Uncharacterized protein n=1 Tax=Peronospora matthiolae TaxID=2874970 RepID=A0AAV1UMJ9_9STRA